MEDGKLKVSFIVNVDNVLESTIRDLNAHGITSFEYEDLYNEIDNEKLKIIFSWLHAGYISLFKTMNERLPTHEYGAHFWAEPSRDLIFIIELTISLQSSLKKTKWAFSVDEYYDSLIRQCRIFLSKSGGSAIPPHMEKVELCYVEPIFHLTESVVINGEIHSYIANLKQIGEGSYANVYKYKDKFYNRYFVLKRAKSNLDEKELQRFKREFEEMQMLNSPYIVEVYSYNDNPHEYTMELMDCSLEKYINTHNSSMPTSERKNIIMQLLRAYGYLHSKGIFHRDISINNVLLKLYDDVIVVKISDFGLVKLADSELTSENTEFKGSLNDPALKIEGFSNYSLIHELYAITLLFAYILTGKSNWAKITDPAVKAFMEKGTNPDKTKRYQTLKELEMAVKKCIEDMR